MPKKRRAERRGWNLVLAVHLLIYVIAWFIALYALANLTYHIWDTYWYYTHFIAAVLFWTLPILLHIGVYVYTDKRIVPDERELYRAGYADATRQFADRAYDERQLLLDEEGELRELPEKRKRDLSQ